MRPSRALRLVVGGCWVGLMAGLFGVWGVPFDRVNMLVWVVATLAVVAVLIGGSLRRLLLDWLPLAGLLLVYDLTRGMADTLGMPVQVESIASAESALFLGHVPTVWLQERLYRHPAWEVAWWEVPITLVYVSHFVVPYVIGAWHWTQGRQRWSYWLRRFAGVTATGLAIYIVLPAAPPWLAAELGVVDPVRRTTARGWSVLGLDIAESAIDMGQASVNLVAAMPSLHAAHAALVPALFWANRKPLARFGLLAYPVTMGAVLVITGEHYVIDIVAGFAVVAMVCWISRRWERRHYQPAGGEPTTSQRMVPPPRILPAREHLCVDERGIEKAR